jgi:hypothetical protein
VDFPCEGIPVQQRQVVGGRLTFHRHSRPAPAPYGRVGVGGFSRRPWPPNDAPL